VVCFKETNKNIPECLFIDMTLKTLLEYLHQTPSKRTAAFESTVVNL